jgi:K(+)-stimulated pyrophosphate-energized sodium pump
MQIVYKRRYTMGVILFVATGSMFSLLFAFFMYMRVKKEPRGNEMMIKIQEAVSMGARAYLKRQYAGVSIFFACMFIVLIIMAAAGFLSFFTPFAFISGGFFSGLSGFIGMRTATMANARTAQGALTSLNKGLRIAFSAGAVMGFTVVGLGLLDLSIWYIILDLSFSHLQEEEKILEITQNMLTFGMGASSMALFARVGGGIFTKAADVGADLVGKVEAGIPEDDPRNPAVIADNVGDNVGDVAGMGADLYESYVGSIVSTCALAVAAGYGIKGISVPLLIAFVGVIASILGTFLVRTKEGASQKNLLKALRVGTYVSAALIAVSSFFVVKIIMPDNLGLYAGIISGLVAGIGIGIVTEYFTSDHYSPTKKLSKSSETGAATVIISGLSLGMMSTFLPVIIVAISILVSFYATGGGDDFNAGLYGIGLSAVGMLSTLGITLATDAYGPVADNAGGIAEMTHMEGFVRERTDALDSLGNTTAATGKGFAIGSAALTALALIASYIDKVKQIDPDIKLDLAITNPKVLVGLFLGGMLPFIFAAFTMDAVGRAAQSIVIEVRRQFREIKGIMEGETEPDYAACVTMCTKSAQKLMIIPAIIAVLSPILTGLLIGVEGVAGLLAGNTVTGFVLAIMMANSGGAWDNAKKYIERGEFGGKGSPSHKAAVVGDTVGDPFKDTSGPSINILIKLTSMVSIVFASLVIAFHLL